MTASVEQERPGHKLILGARPTERAVTVDAIEHRAYFLLFCLSRH